MNLPRVSKDSNKNWNNNAIQFARLIAELEAAGGFPNSIMNALCESMDLDMGQISEIIDRAQGTWDAIKDKTCQPKRR